MSTITLSNDFALPEEAVTWKMGIVGRTGSGKTNTAIVMAEQMCERSLPFVILDPQGDWWGLRTKYQVQILGGAHGDVPLDPKAGEVVADFVMECGVPTLLDMSDMGEGEMVRFATDFARRLYAKNKHAIHVFLDEADMFAPQSGMGNKAQCLGAWQNVVRRGRSKGIGVTMITQRPAVINKDLFTQCDPMFVHQLASSNDLGAIDKYLDYFGYAKSDRRPITERVAKYQTGDALVLALGSLRIEPTHIGVSKRKSFDSSAAPKAKGRKAVTPEMVKINLDALGDRMKDAVAQAEQNDPKLLKKRIAELEKQVKEQKPDQSSIDDAVRARDAYWQNEIDLRRKITEKALQQLGGIIGEIGDVFKIANATPPKTQASTPIDAPPPSKPKKPTTKSDRLSGPHQKILDAIAFMNLMGIDAPHIKQVALIAGYTNSGTFSNYASDLHKSGLINRNNGTLSLTDEGMYEANYETHPSPIEMRASVVEMVRRLKGGNIPATLLNWLIQQYLKQPGRWIKVADVAAANGYANSGTFSNYLSKLSTAGVIDRENGMVRAVDVLFPEVCQ
ncbi:MAG: DUF87 domain-containing protein [Phycisphaeraceae bacterium]|nr:DUF87 domain-containing protein [Phycisphaerales bacterium]MCB9858861.1 DUF87 domain-containing protein [Phycisphaeraceae bacterium]